jgi:foldase protein PrsA
MEMKTSRLLLVPFVLAVMAVLTAGCGGGSSGSVPGGAVAMVGSTQITTAQFNRLVNVGLARYRAQKQPLPKPGSAAYTTIKDEAITFLVQQEQLHQEAQKLGVTVTQKEINARLALIKKTYYHGSEKRFLADLKAHYLSFSEFVLYEVEPPLLAQEIQTKVTSSVKVSKAAAETYYNQNKATQFTTQAETTRSVRHILVDSKSLAKQLEKKLANGASFAKLAKKYSKDTTSAAHGGKLTAVKGQLVKPFQKVAFSLKTGAISQPVHSVYGWHIIQALGPIKNTPAHVTPFSKAESQIRSTLASQQKQVVWSNWLAKLTKDFKGRIHYQAGYAPPATTTSSVPTPTTTG